MTDRAMIPAPVSAVFACVMDPASAFGSEFGVGTGLGEPTKVVRDREVRWVVRHPERGDTWRMDIRLLFARVTPGTEIDLVLDIRMAWRYRIFFAVFGRLSEDLGPEAVKRELGFSDLWASLTRCALGEPEPAPGEPVPGP